MASLILFAGAARTPLAGGASLTLTREDAALLGGPPALLLHVEGWAHFWRGAAPLREAFARCLSDRLHLPGGGATITL